MKQNFFNEEIPFLKRHIGSNPQELTQILQSLKVSSLDELTKLILPDEIQDQPSFHLKKPLSEEGFLQKAQKVGGKNNLFKNYIGMGYHPTVTPQVIARNVLQNPVWYTSYTPYQSELAQGRLEALFNFQTLIKDLTGMELTNASLLDEGTATAEALVLCKNVNKKRAEASRFFVDQHTFPQTLDVLNTRSQSLGWTMEVGDFKSFKGGKEYFAAIIQYPNSLGSVENIQDFIQTMEASHISSVVITDPLSLCLLTPPGEMGATVAVGSAQRLGIPLFFGGPHAAFFATQKAHARSLPGRVVGLSKDKEGRPALRLALQTREQHIRREKATSNICTAQALLATLSSFYAIYHGPQGLQKIASKINKLTQKLYEVFEVFEGVLLNSSFFDTLSFELKNQDQAQALKEVFLKHKINVAHPHPSIISLSLNEQTQEEDVEEIKNILEKQDVVPKKNKSNSNSKKQIKNSETQTKNSETQTKNSTKGLPQKAQRKSPYLQHPVFNQYHSETLLTRYIHQLQSKEISLAHSMISLGSCTMKLNGTTQMLPLGWPEFADIHPFAPQHQSQGYKEMLNELEEQLCELTGFDKFSFQPNAGSQGEYAGLLAIKAYHQYHQSQQQQQQSQQQPQQQAQQQQQQRDVCLIPTSAHGTNPASAAMAGLKVVPVACTQEGPIDLKDLKEKLKIHHKNLAGMMITYPSTYGIFESPMKEICNQIHQAGGLVYLDGANMNALLGLCKPRHIGFDVCHLNLHKTFCIPHGGGGPGAGPIGVTQELAPFLPSHWMFQQEESNNQNTNPKNPNNNPNKQNPNNTNPNNNTNNTNSNTNNTNSNPVGAISSAPYGSAAILTISWAYICLMGFEGLKKSAQVAMAHANYIAEKLRPHYRILFSGKNNKVAHECIVDFRKFRNTAGITIDDIAKRLVDYSFHAPTMSWPIAGTLMIEPTESESKEELDKFCEALISIKKELEQTEKNLKFDLLKNAPHPLEKALEDSWPFEYSKAQAFYPLDWVKERKFWPPVSRIEQAYGDINLVCSCPPVESFAKD